MLDAGEPSLGSWMQRMPSKQHFGDLLLEGIFWVEHPPICSLGFDVGMRDRTLSKGHSSDVGFSYFHSVTPTHC